jgi:hypothetical protein
MFGVIKIIKMKKAVLLFMLITSIARSQEGLSIYIDPSMAINGAYDTSEYGELDLLLKFSPINDPTHEAGVSIEVFKAIEFYNMEFFYNRRLRYKKIEGLCGAGLGFIARDTKDGSGTYSSASLNIESRYYIIDKIALCCMGNYRYRGDLHKIYSDDNPFRFSTFVGINYNF